MRGRICELEALLAAMQMQMEKNDEMYTEDLRELHRQIEAQRMEGMKEKTLKKCHSCTF